MRQRERLNQERAERFQRAFREEEEQKQAKFLLEMNEANNFLSENKEGVGKAEEILEVSNPPSEDTPIQRKPRKKRATRKKKVTARKKKVSAKK